jgi:hypothetical protein
MKPDLPCRATVLQPYTAAYPNALQTEAGEILSVEPKDSEWSGWIWCVNSHGKGGWVPERLVQRNGNTVRMLQDYDAVELTVSVNETLTIESSESGWLWCITDSGQKGWLPAQNVEILAGKG